MSDGSRSHCKMVSESPWSLHKSLRTCLLHLSFHIHVQSVGSCSVFQNKAFTLSNGKFAVFGDALGTFVRFRLCFALTRDVHHGLNGMCVNSCFIFSDSEGLTSAGTHDFCVSPARTHDFCESPARTHDFCESSARTRMIFLQLCEYPARTHDSCDFRASPARTHECCESPARTRDALTTYTPRSVFQFRFRSSNRHSGAALPPPPRGNRTVSGGFRSSARFDAFRNLGVFFRPRLAVELIRLVPEESTIITRPSSLTSQHFGSS